MSSLFNIDCSSAVSDNLITLADFVEYLNRKMKVNHLRNNLKGKITIEPNTSNMGITITATVKYSKRAVRYYARKFLQKVSLHQRFRVVSSTKDTYELRPYGPTSKE